MEALLLQEFEKQINESPDLFQVLDGKIYKKILADENYNFIYNLADWKNFITLTFRDYKFPDVALSNFRYLIRILNEDLLGKNYRKKVGWSYFTYCLGIEYQKRDVIHFHWMADEPLNFQLIHRWWNTYSGFAWTSKKRSQEDVCNYMVKYNLKGGQVDVFRKEKNLDMPLLPDWYKY